MLKVVDVFKNPAFRGDIVSAVKPYRSEYTIPNVIPMLYKYSGFSKYAVENIVNEGLSLSLIGTFNDCYDSTISFGDIKQRAVEEYEKDCRICEAAGCTPCLSLDDWYAHIVTEQEAYRGFSNDSHCCCFSESADSTLMWSHYANNNRGICVAYNFESITGHPFYYSLFPVAYTDMPIDVYDFVHEYKGTYSVELGVVASALNKAKCWEYEKEWRLLVLNERLVHGKVDTYLAFKNVIAPQSVILGQHFLDNFIPALNRGGERGATEALGNLKKILAYQRSKNIPIYRLTATQNAFGQQQLDPVDLNAVINFIEEQAMLDELTLQNRNYLYLSYNEELS